MLITVIIPTYNRPLTLLQALQSLQEQSSSVFEILIVDNAADMAVEKTISAFNQTARLPAIYVPEPRLGVHYARNKAAQMASGELLLFTDDDMTFDPRWVEAYAEAFSNHWEMSAAGGPVRPHWEQTPPQWLLDYIRKSVSFGILSIMEPYHAFNLSERGYFYSCNMAIRKSKLIERGGFHPEATGDIWIGDGESGLNRDMRAKGDLIGYVPEASAYHHIPPSRMTPAYFRKRMANQGSSDVYTRFHYGIPNVVSLVLRMIKIVFLKLPAMGMAIILWDRTSRIALTAQIRAAHAYSQICHIIRLIREPNYRAMILEPNWMQPMVEKADET